jgi:hypothetical protein
LRHTPITSRTVAVRAQRELEPARRDLLELGDESVEAPALLVDLDDVARPDRLRRRALDARLGVRVGVDLDQAGLDHGRRIVPAAPDG